MASVTKREWTSPKGEPKSAWVVRYTDRGGRQRSRQFEKKKQADTYRIKIEGDLLHGVLMPEAEVRTLKDVATEFMRDME